MYVCVCNAVTEREIAEARDAGARTLEDLGRELRVATCCGRCADHARRVLQDQGSAASSWYPAAACAVGL
jgi:bacterioferritin-associated ferredoxin